MPSTTSKNKPEASWRFQAIGTHWSIETSAPLDKVLQTEITKRIEIFDKTYSRFRDDSLISQLAKRAGEYDFPADAKQLVLFYRHLYVATDGAMSPLVGDILEAAGYDKAYSLKPHGQYETARSWGEIMTWQGTRVDMHQPAIVDFGAVGKGYLVDIVGELLEQSGHKEYTIDASGDVRIRGAAQTIGLENPYDASRVIGSVPLTNASLCASATNRRAWGEWHHIVDPRSGKPVRDIVATWVVADSTLLADGLATALFFVPAEQLAEWQFDYVRLFADNTVEYSPGFVGQLFI